MSPAASGTHCYFAFGSNLWPAQMARRCPLHELLGPASLAGWRLAFGGHSRNWGGGAATLLRDAEHTTPGLLYALGEEDLAALDRWEHYPHAHDRITVHVRTVEGLTRTALTYVRTDYTPNPPSAAYLYQLWRAYRRFGLNEGTLFTALEASLPPDWEPAAPGRPGSGGR